VRKSRDKPQGERGKPLQRAKDNQYKNRVKTKNNMRQQKITETATKITETATKNNRDRHKK
jgi:hypothetical protein